jgi:arylsulfatase A-like enzyme
LISSAPWLPTDLSVKEVALVTAAASWLDETLVELLQQAEAAASGHAAGLLIILSADHGPGWAGKGHPYEAGVRVPLLMKLPAPWAAANSQGSSLPGRVTHLDLLPTLDALALPTPGLRASVPTHGKSFVDTLHSTAHGSSSLVHPRNSTFFIEVGYSRTVVTSHWKLIVVSPPPSTRPGCVSFQGTPMDSFIAAFDAGDKKPKQALIYDGYRHHSATYCDPIQLYSLVADPAETTNLAEREPDVTSELGLALEGFVHMAEPTARFRVRASTSAQTQPDRG